MRLAPQIQPPMRLHYKWMNEHNEILENRFAEGKVFQYNNRYYSFSFDIDNMGDILRIEFDMRNQEFLNNVPYTMVQFELMKLERTGEFLYVGTLRKTDLVTGLYNIKIAGHLYHNPSLNSLPHMIVPRI
ncbi:hypothetical protein [Pontibacter chinhatensis]|uniref:Uncharacterized protein n=1 Tax=Pontibacter chinhatensis TaxID=1436961 RepID=A0A1I2ZMA0_9BACT|nr:hypothetical protein [Pontibacter chinhatensis]SFH38874.1 hypothetical protein SAMN05421739_1163 [Pontibacter chinhatensis]